ncbi:hypothetical protein [uncultured Methylobacterium sp.]|uniref:hypothetical protein n=1 Tax=uncultured Methylobacterium sp. TaxID=157278 RepID=UPI0025917388|nr:hypothetical protein [uncultured Methylobacterium sp.]
MPLFDHRFDPPGASSLGSSVDLTTREIEDAGLLEVLQTPGAALGTWSLFSALIDTTTNDFRFHEPLGKSREVKTALSGLFGRFVARAYSTRELKYNFFSSIHSPPMALGRGHAQVKRLKPGDLPDWAVWGPIKGLGIVEAKGSHDWAGPGASLERAYVQTERAELQVGGRTAAFKRYAISTRWGFMRAGPERPMLWVKDPDEAGDGVSEAELERLGLGIARRHYAALLRPLGHAELAAALLAMAEAGTEQAFFTAQASARSALASSPRRNLTSDTGVEPEDGLVGGFVTRSGPLDVPNLDPADGETLHRLSMGPTFVGSEHRVLNDIIEGRQRDLAATSQIRRSRRPSGDVRVPRDDGMGTWVFRIREDAGSLS